MIMKMTSVCNSSISSAGTRGDPGSVVRGVVSRRGVWGPLKVPSGPRQSPGRGPEGGRSPPEALEFEELQTFI